MNWVKRFQDGLKLVALLGLIAVIIWTMPEQSVYITSLARH